MAHQNGITNRKLGIKIVNYRTNYTLYMRKYLFLLMTCFFFSPVFSQEKDSLFAEQSADGWEIPHQIKPKETIFSIARNYHTPPALLASYNDMTIRQSLKPGSKIYIPLGAYNLKTESGMHTSEMRPFYHRLKAGESLKKIAKNSNISQHKLLEWNNMTTGNIYEGEILLTGWILFDATNSNYTEIVKSEPTAKPTPPTTISQQPNTNTVTHPASNLPVPPPPYHPNKATDSTYTIVIPSKTPTDSTDENKSEVEILYDSQTMNGVNAVSEKGPAAFFKSNNANPSFYYAFHNTAAKGSIIKVKNLNNGKVVFVKVLGHIPATGQYYNCIIGISGKARAALGATGEKMWCELSYAR